MPERSWGISAEEEEEEEGRENTDEKRLGQRCKAEKMAKRDASGGGQRGSPKGQWRDRRDAGVHAAKTLERTVHDKKGRVRLFGHGIDEECENWGLEVHNRHEASGLCGGG